MILRLYLVGLTAAWSAFVGSTHASAQLKPEAQTGSRIPVKPQGIEDERAGRVKKGFARCILASQPARVAALLKHSDPNRIDTAAAGLPANDPLSALPMDKCLGEQATFDQLALSMKFSSQLLRAMLQEESYLSSFRQPQALPQGAVETISRTYVSPPEALGKARAMGEFADCVVFKNHAGADALLRTVPGGTAERAAARALAPALGACLIQGQTLSLTPVGVRSFAADGLWTRFVRQSPVVAGRK